MKIRNKLSIFLIVLFIAVLCSCGNLLYINKGKVSFDLPQDVCKDIASRAGIEYNTALVTAKAELFVNDKLYSVEYKKFPDRSEPVLSFVFKNVPLKSTAYARLSIYLDDLEFGSGESAPIEVTEGQNNLEILLKMIKYSVPCTKYMIQKEVWDESQYEYKYDYYLRDSSNAYIPDGAKPDFRDVKDYCFDSKGNVFAFTEDEDGVIWLESNKRGFTKIFIKDNESSNIYPGQIFSDMATGDVYYSYYENTDSIIKKIGTDAGWSGQEWQLFENYEPMNTLYSIYRIAAYDDWFYIFYIKVESNEIDYYITKRKVSAYGEELKFTGEYSSISINIEDTVFNTTDSEYNFNEDNNIFFPQMIYQDGYLYLLYYYTSVPFDIQYKDSSKRQDLYSYGGIIKIDYENTDINQLGFQADVIDLHDSGKLSVIDHDKNILITKTENRTDYLTYTFAQLSYLQEEAQPLGYDISCIPMNYFVKLYSPNKINSTKLFGPHKLIAVKPKKLIFSDEGYCFYLDTDDICRYKKVNRVVTVDLEDFSVTDIVQNKNTAKSEDDGIHTYDYIKVETIGSNFFDNNSNGICYVVEGMDPVVYGYYPETNDYYVAHDCNSLIIPAGK